MENKRTNNFKDLTGNKYGKLIVIEFLHKSGVDSFWKCSCDCGNSCIKKGRNIVRGKTSSCGCMKNTLSKGESGLNVLYNSYIDNAKKRSLIFNLTKEQFKTITQKDCHYCKIKPIQVVTTSKSKSTKRNIEHSKYFYNGIDRVDNNVGYELYNCVSCCSICNRSKHIMSYQEFMSYIERFKCL